MTRNQCLSILELRPDATPTEIAKAYRQMALVWHPDRFANNPELKEKAHVKLAEINEAYKILEDLEEAQKNAELKPPTSPPHRGRRLPIPGDELFAAPKEKVSLGTWILCLIFLALGGLAIYDQTFAPKNQIVTPASYAETKGNFTVWTEPQFPQSGEPFLIGISIYVPGKGQVYKTDDFSATFVGPTRDDVIFPTTKLVPTRGGIASFICRIPSSENVVGEEFQVSSRILGQEQRFSVGMTSTEAPATSVRLQKTPDYAITQGNMSVWMDPRDPKPGHDYELVIQLKLPPNVTTYSGSDLTAKITGPNNFLREIWYEPHQFLHIENGMIQIRVDVPNAAPLIRHSVYVESKMLKEEEQFEIEYP